MKTKEDLADPNDPDAGLCSVFIGHAPQQREMDRFYSRHGYSAGGAVTTRVKAKQTP